MAKRINTFCKKKRYVWSIVLILFTNRNASFFNTSYTNRELHLVTDTGQESVCKLDNYDALRKATESQLSEYRLSMFGIHWDNVNESLLFTSILGINECVPIELDAPLAKERFTV